MRFLPVRLPLQHFRLSACETPVKSGLFTRLDMFSHNRLLRLQALDCWQFFQRQIVQTHFSPPRG